MATGSLICGSEANSSMRNPGSILKVFNALSGLYGGPDGWEQEMRRTVVRIASDSMVRLNMESWQERRLLFVVPFSVEPPGIDGIGSTTVIPGNAGIGFSSQSCSVR